MELIRGLHNLRDRHRGCVLSIGNFDGFHRGHQALVARLREQAGRFKVPATVQMFEPTPRDFFAPGRAPGRIATLRDRLARLATAGVERVLCVRFNRHWAALPATEYIETVLVRRLGVKAVVVGDDFRFGAARGGDFTLLRDLGRQHGFDAEALGTVTENGGRVSSTAVRAVLAVPDLERAAQLLGRPYSLSGRVRPGLQLGRTLGMPTANIVLRRRPALCLGVYAVEAEMGGRRWPGVASIGVRPTLQHSSCLLETHLFGDVGELYGAVMDVTFLKFLRSEQRFESLKALAVQMQRDLADAKRHFTKAAQNDFNLV
ncbi:MAG: bifunctional riboflavin kinase/FAD synthetase [Nevskiales bacterium]|nr:bifunctional riboflavin kinase/FAD synthetase [Nevskiales bacterium]